MILADELKKKKMTELWLLCQYLTGSPSRLTLASGLKQGLTLTLTLTELRLPSSYV